MNRRNLVRLLGVSGVASLAGCGNVPGVTSASIDDASPAVENGFAVLLIEYEIDDYATALLEGPDDRVISEERIEPEHTTSSLPIGSLGGGEYDLLLRQNGETVASETLTFDGPDPVVTDVTSNWSDNELASVDIAIENTGDLPVLIEGAQFTFQGEEFETNVSQYLDVGATQPVEVEVYFGSYGVDSAGIVEGEAYVSTSAGGLWSTFSHELAPASLRIVSVDPVWDGNVLQEVGVVVENTGDVPTESELSVTESGEEIGGSRNTTIDPGETVELSGTDIGSLYEAESGGTADFEVTVDSPSGSVSESFSREIAGADVSIDSLEPSWGSGQLVALSVTVTNGGEVDSEAPTEVRLDDDVIIETSISVPAGETIEHTLFDMSETYENGIAITSGGSHEVVAELDVEGGPLTASETKEFDGKDASFSGIDVRFLSAGYDTDDVELTSVNFDVRNDGDVVIPYDSVKVELGGASRTDGLVSTEWLLPGSSGTEYWSTLDNIVVSPGDHDLTISLVLNGDEVVSTTQTVTAE